MGRGGLACAALVGQGPGRTAASDCVCASRAYDRPMRAGRGYAAAGLAACLWLGGCGARAAAPAHSAADAATLAPSAGGAPGVACARPSGRARFREMTWDEYYADVRERAWRQNATIIWITPPSMRKRHAQPASDVTACTR